MHLLSSIYSDFIVGTNYNSLPSEVTLEAKKRILDTLGVALAGSLWQFPQIVVDRMVEVSGKPEATIIRTKSKRESDMVNLTVGFDKIVKHFRSCIDINGIDLDFEKFMSNFKGGQKKLFA